MAEPGCTESSVTQSASTFRHYLDPRPGLTTVLLGVRAATYPVHRSSVAARVGWGRLAAMRS